MRFRFPKIKIAEVITFFMMWIFGVGIFYMLIILCREKFHYQISWQDGLYLSVTAGFIWTIIGTTMSAKDEKKVADRKAIRDTVAKWFNETHTP